MRQALGKTLGVPLFQEQMMQIAIDCASFTPTEADQLRQAMSSKRAPERIEELRARLLDGMAASGIPPQVAEDIYVKILAFSSYGFPESHAISFAYLVYASAWLKCYYPAAFTAALLRAQPMGFYAPASLISDVRRHGVEVRGVDVNASAVLATLEKSEDSHNAPSPPRRRPPASVAAPAQPAIRLGLSEVRNLGEKAAAVVAGQPYRDLEDFARRTRLPAPALEALATAGAFGCFGIGRREALWAAGAAATIRPGQLPGTTPGLAAPPLPAMTAAEETFADLWATGTYGTHPIEHIRPRPDRPRRDRGGGTEDGQARRERDGGRAGHAPAAAGHGPRGGLPEPGGRDRDGQHHLPARGLGAAPAAGDGGERAGRPGPGGTPGRGGQPARHPAAAAPRGRRRPQPRLPVAARPVATRPVAAASGNAASGNGASGSGRVR